MRCLWLVCIHTASEWSWALVKGKGTVTSLGNYNQIIVRDQHWTDIGRGERETIDRWFLLSYQSQIPLSGDWDRLNLTLLRFSVFSSLFRAACSPHPLRGSDDWLGAHTHHLAGSACLCSWAGACQRLLPAYWCLLCSFRLTWSPTSSVKSFWRFQSGATTPVLFVNIF